MEQGSLQTQAWASEFGVEYTDRNDMTMEEMDALYQGRYGVSRKEMNKEFICGFDKSIRILEVGSNIGNQLLCLQKMGFSNLYGVELSAYAVELAKNRTKNINIICGSVLDIPFKNGFFDLVFTSALLIHINPQEVYNAMREIYRCSKSYIWGMEYFAEEYTQIKYRRAKETSDLLWKANFPKIYCESFNGLKAVKVEYYKYLNEDNVDVMYLLEKRNPFGAIV